MLMDTRTNGSFDNNKNIDSENNRNDKQEKLDISRNLRRVNSDSLSSEQKDQKDSRNQKNLDNQGNLLKQVTQNPKDKTEMREGSKAAYKTISNDPASKSVPKPVAKPSSKPIAEPNPKSFDNTHSKDNNAEKDLNNNSKSKYEKSSEEKRFSKPVKQSEQNVKSQEATKTKDAAKAQNVAKTEKSTEVEKTAKAEETTKLFTSDEMRQIQEAEKRREKSSKSEHITKNQKSPKEKENYKKFEETQDDYYDQDVENVEPEEKGPSKFALAMSDFGEKFGAWSKKQQANFKDWNARRKAEAAERQAEKQLELERLEQEREADRAEAERLAKIANERAMQEQSEQEEWSRLLGVDEQKRYSARRRRNLETDTEVSSSKDINKYRNVEVEESKEVETESNSEKLFQEYRQRQLHNPNNVHDYYVSNRGRKGNRNGRSQSESKWTRSLKNAAHNISSKFNNFRNDLRRKDEMKSTQGRVEQGVGAKIKHGIEYLFIRSKTKHLVMMGIAFIALLILIFYLLFRSPISGFKDALARRNYQEAGQVYEKYIGNSKKSSAAEEELANYIAKLKDNAINGNTSFAATYSVLETMKSTPLNQGNAQAIIDKSLEEVLNLQEVNRYYESAVSSLESMDVKAAIRNFNRVSELIPGYKETNKYLAQAKSNYREEVMKKVNTLQSQGKYIEAAKAIDEGLELLPQDPLLTKTKESNKSEAESSLSKEVKEQAERFFRAGKFNELFKSIDDALKSSPNDESIKRLKDEFETKYAESIIKTADSLFKQDSKEAALEKIDEGLKILPNNNLLERSKYRYEFNLDASDEEIDILRKNKDKETNKTEANHDDEDEKPEDKDRNSSDGLARGSYKDVAGNQHSNSVLLSHNFDGDTSVVDQQKFENNNNGRTFKGEIAIGEIDDPTQIYYQIYSSNNLSSPISSGSLSANPNSSGGKYSVSVNVPSSGVDYFIVNINYLSGNDINVVLDLAYK